MKTKMSAVFKGESWLRESRMRFLSVTVLMAQVINWTFFCCLDPVLCVTLKFQDTYFSIVIPLTKNTGILVVGSHDDRLHSQTVIVLANCSRTSIIFKAGNPQKGAFSFSVLFQPPLTQPNSWHAVQGASCTVLEWHGQLFWPML
jgi:hypothetical protein